MLWRHDSNLNLNVRLAVNMKFKMATAAAASNAATSLRLRSDSAVKPFGGISSILIINLFVLLLLSLRCDVCKSNDLSMDNVATQLTAATAVTAAAVGVIDQIDSNLTVFNDANENSPDLLLHDLVTSGCLQRCGAEQGVFLDEFGIECAVGDTREMCFKARCTKGCEQWWRALKEFEPCREACSSTQFYPFDLPCISACEMAQRHYWHLQRLAMEVRVTSSLPQLLNNSLAVNSLTLQWHITFPDNYLASRPFNIQYQYAGDEENHNEEMTTKQDDSIRTQSWFNLADYNCDENFDCEILDGLMPYTNYRLRFELPFGDSPDDILYSPATAIFKTFATGAPISKPLISSAFPLDHSHVAVFWQQGKFTNGPLKGYKLILVNVKQNTTLEKLLPSNTDRYIFAELMPLTNYTLQIAMFNAEGDGPYAEVSLVTMELIKTSSDLVADFNDLLIVGEYHIKLKSLEPLSETKLLYQSESLLSDYGLFMTGQRLFVIDVDGIITSLFLNNTAERTSILLDFDDFKPQKLSVDWLNQRLFIAGEIPGKLWAIICTDLEGNMQNVLTTALTESIEQLEVDPINGWLFWAHSTGVLARLNMATFTIQTLLNTTDNKIAHFTNDYKRFLLIVYNKIDRELYELSYDGTYRGKLTMTNNNNNSNHNTTNHIRTLQGEWQSFQHFNDAGTILATNGTHLMRQNYHTNEHDIWVIRDLEWCWGMLPLTLQHQQQKQQQQQQLLQPLPMPHSRPESLQALLTANMAKISWSAPATRSRSQGHVSDYQTDYAWQQWEYELEIMDVASNSAFNIRNIKTTYFNVEKLQANNLYKLRVRATAPPAASRYSAAAAAAAGGGAGDGGGEWSEELLTRTWPRGAHKFLWATATAATTDKGWLYETNELGESALRLGALENSEGIQDFVQLNGTIYYITRDKERRLQCANIMNPELNCSFTTATAAAAGGGGGTTSAVTNAVSLAYDWRGGRIYWTDGRRNCLLRANLSGGERELLPIFDAQHIKIDAYNGYIYYSTGQRLARRTLNGGNFETSELEYFHVNGFGGQIRGFALDDATQLYWVVRQQEGHVRLFRSSAEQRNPHKFEDRLLNADIELNSLQYLSALESLMWLQANSSKLVLLRTADAFGERPPTGAVIALPQLGRMQSVRTKRDYTPFMDQSVIPEAVDVGSIHIDDGYWDDFNIRWTPITTAENYTVFYKVLLQYGSEQRKLRFYTLEVTEPFIRITEFHQPQLLLNVSITAHTYWRAGATTHAQLRTPNAAPTQPRRLRIFVQRYDEPLQMAPNISAVIRWDAPENVSVGAEIAYKVYCWHGEDLFAERLHNFSSEQPLEAAIGDLSTGETYTFQVQAFAAGRTSGGEKTTFHALHINPDVQAVPRLLYATSEVIAELDLDLQSRKVLVHTASEVEHLFVLQGEQRLLWVNENVELMSFVPGAAAVKLARMRAEVLALTVDWIMRVVYWAEMDTDVEHAVSIYKLNLCQFEGRVMLGTKMWTSAPGRAIKDLIVLPFAQMLLWQEFGWGAGVQNATLVGRNLSDSSVLKFKSSAALLRMFEGSLTAELETVNLVDHKGKMCAYDVHRHMCNPLKMHFNVVMDVITDIDRDAGYIYALKNDSIRVYNRRKQNLEYMLEMVDVRKIRAFNYQQYPARKCLLPESEDVLNVNNQLIPHVAMLEEYFIILDLPLVNTNEECSLNVPGLKYQLIVLDAQNNTLNFTSYESTLNITQLAPFTNYSIQIRISSYYQQKLGLPLLEPAVYNVRTAVGTPTAPQNFSAYALSPTEIHVSWLAPLVWHSDRIWYQLHWQMDNSTLSAFKTLEQTFLTVSNLEPAQEYSIWLQVYSTEHKFNTTARVNVLTFERPSPLLLLQRSAYNFTLGWATTSNLSNIMLVYRAINLDVGDGVGEGVDVDVADTANSIDITNNSTHVFVPDLSPKTKYEFYLALTYASVERPYHWPEAHHERFVYETLGDSPSSPGQPQIEHIAGEIFKIYWEPARNNGAPVLEYSLEALQARLPTHNSINNHMKRKRRDALTTSNATTTASMERVYMAANKTIAMLSQLPWVEELQPIEDKWLVVCNTSSAMELSCIVREMYTLRLSIFRVRARNKPYGWGPYSAESARVFEPFVSPEKRNSLVMAIIAPAAIVSSCVILLVLVRMVQNRRLRAKKLLEKSRPSIWSNYSTQQQQQQLMASRNRAFSVTSHSTMYTGGPLSDADIALLPHVSWNQITLLSFLGSGAFGEVYEGLVKHEDEEEPEKVAIKSLRKGASEFAELLQEAQLMSNFRHENIVRLIGVCFDTESISIIMEHMEGGDLLNYLRESRPNSNKPIASLQLIDLMTMCIDVATGCSYLEDMHFVHRDLACRNCLVSSRIPSRRVVKIGDFGLARDIYKNDYYRKEGEGLLPVRWMSPESLVDGVFTMQSDVWAFAVLCWEILSLGQQPYAARNNFEVLNFVKEAGRLEQPENCPDKLFTLMLQCWHEDPEERPSFRRCLNALLSIKTDVRRVSLGYNMDDPDFPMYANHNGIVLSSFLANPLPKVDEEEVAEDSTVSEKSFNEKSDLKVRFESPISEVMMETKTHANETQLTTNDLMQNADAKTTTPEFYENEGVSRL